MIYPINEIFYSLKGEGVWTGTPMLFVRMQGCNLNCSFCDTPDVKNAELSEYEILTRMESLNESCSHVVITGGEPLLQRLEPLLLLLKGNGYRVHLETNGSPTCTSETIDIFDWVALSPKRRILNTDVLMAADEVKFLIDDRFYNEAMIDDILERYERTFAIRAPKLFLMPIAKGCLDVGYKRDESDINEELVTKCIEICKRRPEFSLCMQMHKLLNIP